MVGPVYLDAKSAQKKLPNACQKRPKGRSHLLMFTPDAQTFGKVKLFGAHKTKRLKVGSGSCMLLGFLGLDADIPLHWLLRNAVIDFLLWGFAALCIGTIDTFESLEKLKVDCPCRLLTDVLRPMLESAVVTTVATHSWC